MRIRPALYDLQHVAHETHEHETSIHRDHIHPVPCKYSIDRQPRALSDVCDRLRMPDTTEILIGSESAAGEKRVTARVP